MRIGASIWAELGPLAECVECIEHDDGRVIYKPDATEAQKSAVQSKIDTHDPLISDRAQACAEIDAIAEQVRLRYITPGAGQSATYITKQMQAAAYRDAGYAGPVPAFVQAEADSLGVTPQEGAGYILAAAAMWEVKGAEIERIRRVWKLWMENHSTNIRADLVLARTELEAL